MIKRIAYFNPVIRVTTHSDDGRKFSSYSVSADGEMCRENVLRYLWYSMKIAGQMNAAPVDATGKGSLLIDLEVGVPSETVDPKNKNVWGPPSNSALMKRIRGLKDSSAERYKFCSLIDVLVAVPMVLALGPKAYVGDATPGSFTFSEADHGYDLDVPTSHIDFKYSNLTNAVMRHPVLLCIVLAQARWGIEEYTRDRFKRFDAALGIATVRTALMAMSKKEALDADDVTYLRKTFDTMVALSDSLLVKRRLDRYPVNKLFSKSVLDFLLSMGNYPDTAVNKTWQSTVGGGIYGAVAGYGFYKWLEQDSSKQADKRNLYTLAKQAYSSIEQRAHVING